MNYSIGRYSGTFSFSLLKIPSYVNLWSQSIFREHSLSLDHVLWCRSYPTILILFQPKTKIPFIATQFVWPLHLIYISKGGGETGYGRTDPWLFYARDHWGSVYVRVGEGGEGRRRLGTDVIRLFFDRLPLTITTKIFRSPLRPRIRAGFQVLRFSWT